MCYIEKQKRKEPAGACVTGGEEERSSTVPDLGNANGGKQNIRVRLLALSGGRIFVLRKLCLMKHNIQLHSGIL